MSEGLVWHQLDKTSFKTGLDRGVLYTESGPGVPWNGLTDITDNVSGGEVESYYFEGVKYMDVVASQDYQATLSAYIWPDEFNACDGTLEIAPGAFATLQPRRPFSLAYRSLLGDAQSGTRRGYELHLIYNVMAAPSEIAHKTKTDSPTLESFSWVLYGAPPEAVGYKPTAHLIIDSTKVDPLNLYVIESLLYGYADEVSTLPPQAEVIEILNSIYTEDIDGGNAFGSSNGYIDGNYGTYFGSDVYDAGDSSNPSSDILDVEFVYGGTPTSYDDSYLDGTDILTNHIETLSGGQP